MFFGLIVFIIYYHFLFLDFYSYPFSRNILKAHIMVIDMFSEVNYEAESGYS